MASFCYDGSSWGRKGASPKKVECPPHDSCSSSSSSEDDCCKRGPRGPPGRDGCPGVNGLNGFNGKPGKCECKHSETTTVLYSGTAATYNTTVQAPCWARTALITSVGGGGAGGAATATVESTRAGSGGGSGYSVTQNIPTAGGFLSLSIGQGGQAATASNGNPTLVTYTSTYPYAVYAPGGHAGGSQPANLAVPGVSDGQYGGGGGDGNNNVSPPGHGFEDGDPATLGVSGGDGGGYLGGNGGDSLPASNTYGGGGGGSAPGPIAAPGGNGGGYVLPPSVAALNGTNGAFGSGGGGAGALAGGAPVAGVAGNGGNGYVQITFLY